VTITNPSSPFIRKRFEALEQRERLKKACAWAGISRGRSSLYDQYISEFEGEKRQSQKHLLAFYESLEVSELHELWVNEVERFPGLKAKITDVLEKGPVLQHDENLEASSHQARNNAFTYLLAGRLIASGIEVLAVDGIRKEGQSIEWKGDITIQQGGEPLDVQCKRLQKENQLIKRVKGARDQILREPRPGKGIIALDLSVLIRPIDFLCSDSSNTASQDVRKALGEKIGHKLAQVIYSEKRILGLIILGVVPTLIDQPSGTQALQGETDTISTPHSIDETVFVPNDNSPGCQLLEQIAQQYYRWPGTA
jgi:hypothetical protein